MPRAIANPDEIRAFRSVLLANVNRLRALRADLSAHFNDLHDHWQDEKYTRFQQIFTTSMDQLERFLQEAERYASHLTRKAELLDRYLQHRY